LKCGKLKKEKTEQLNVWIVKKIGMVGQLMKIMEIAQTVIEEIYEMTEVDEFKCGCVNHGNYEFKLCDKHRDIVLDDITENEGGDGN